MIWIPAAFDSMLFERNRVSKKPCEPSGRVAHFVARTLQFALKLFC